MADNWTQSIVCRYYKNGVCREGDNCRYRHPEQQQAATSSREMTDLNDSSDSNSSTEPALTVRCRFFKWGGCKFGNRCRFDHAVESTTTDKKSQAEGESRQGSSSTATSSKNIAHSSSSSSSTSFKLPSEADNSKKGNYEPDEWVKAPEFVPFSIVATASQSTNSDSNMSIRSPPISYARAVNSSSQSVNPASEPLCPYAEATGICKKDDCHYLHGEICDMCGRAALHPYNKDHRQQHTNACVKQHEADMELSFAVQRSRDKSCGVCFEIVMEKSSREQRFGILPNCNHCFCLSCIRKWRQAKQFDNKIIRSCPECRVTSDFVCPSIYWVDTKEEKEKLIVEYKEALSLKDCKYFNKGQGKCPFGNKCFYLHALPDGTKTDVGPPARQNSHGNVDLDFLQQLLLWNFLEERDNRWIYMDDHDEVVVLISDSEDSDWSRYSPFD